MKNNKLLLLVSMILAVSFSFEAMAQIDITQFPVRKQFLNQYSSVFISSPKNQTIIQNIHNDDSQITWANSDKFQYYDNGYVYLPEEAPLPPAVPVYMQAGKGYVIQLGGNGSIGTPRVTQEEFNFGNSSDNGGTISVGVTSGQFNLLGNPYSNYLDLEKFLLNSNNVTKVRGPIYLWAHNTLISSANFNPNDPNNVYLNSANDFALYNVLGGVSAGREISTSPDTGTSTGIQLPTGKICFGTGFGVMSIGTGNVVYDDIMRYTDTSGSLAQSFRLSNDETTTYESYKTTALTPSVRSRIWLFLEKGVPPVWPAINFNPVKSILIGYSPCFGSDCPTVGDNDRVFDAETVTAQSNPSIDFYSFATGSAKHLAIQGRGDFQNNDFFQLGYKATEAGTYTIASTSDGIFSTKPHYILDADDPTGQYWPLPYIFTTAAGTFNSRFKVVFENLVSVVAPANVCGSIISNLDYPVFAQNLSGVTNYRYEVRFTNGNLFGVFSAPNTLYPYRFTLNLPGIAFNTTYFVRVATYQVNGVWQYGPTCVVTTPPSPPPSSITTPACGSTLPSVWTTIRANSINALGIAATNYQFTITQGTNTYFITNTNPNFQLANVPGILPILLNTMYTIRVDVLWNGNLITGTTTCNVITPSTSPRLSENGISIFEASTYPNPFNDNFKLDINTSSEKEIQLLVFDMLGRQMETKVFQMSDLNNLEVGTNYASGVYNVILKQGENIKTLRVIKR